MRFSDKYVLRGVLMVLVWSNAGREVSAWGPDGHEAIVRLAQTQLSEAAQAAIVALLEPEEELNSLGVWADAIRELRPQTKPWHYINLMFDEPAFDALKHAKNPANVVSQIERLTKVLQDTTQTRTARREALLFLIHLVADLHQPLHCCSRLTAEGGSDLGGNKVSVLWTFSGEETNLHKLWDDFLVKTELAKRTPAEYLVVLEQHRQALTPEAQAELIAGGTVDWCNQSHLLAIRHAYGEIPIQAQAVRIEQAYVDQALPVLRMQMLRAGLRLAKVLNSVLK